MVADLARRRIAGADVTRVSVIAGDALTGDLPTGYDTFLLANLIHYYSPDQNRALLSRIRAVDPPGACLLLADFWTNHIHTEPVHAALMAGEFAVHLRTGDVYSVDEITTWLTETGWHTHNHVPLSGPI